MQRTNKIDSHKKVDQFLGSCHEDFSNIHGLTQVRYPKGNISAKFHEVRAVLEREKLL